MLGLAATAAMIRVVDAQHKQIVARLATMVGKRSPGASAMPGRNSW